MRKLVLLSILASGCFSADDQGDGAAVDDMARAPDATVAPDFAPPDLSQTAPLDAAMADAPILDAAMADTSMPDLAHADLVMLPDLMSTDLAIPQCQNAQQCMGLPHATGKCVNGSCVIDFCDLNYGDCDKAVANGCESDSLNDAANCNFCGISCLNVANGVGACVNGACAIASCNQGFANCDNMFMTGCATPTASDITNCGGCGVLCAIANASSSCMNGMCGFIACNNGFADCDNSLMNGCEVSLQSDNANCSMCGMSCPMNLPSCESGVCSVDDFPPIYLLYELEEAG